MEFQYSFCSFSGYGDHRDLHSFPTRRSSDLQLVMPPAVSTTIRARRRADTRDAQLFGAGSQGTQEACNGHTRSEEHTSELQSRRDLVCRLLLEKKKDY